MKPKNISFLISEAELDLLSSELRACKTYIDMTPADIRSLTQVQNRVIFNHVEYRWCDEVKARLTHKQAQFFYDLIDSIACHFKSKGDSRYRSFITIRKNVGKKINRKASKMDKSSVPTREIKRARDFIGNDKVFSAIANYEKAENAFKIIMDIDEHACPQRVRDVVNGVACQARRRLFEVVPKLHNLHLDKDGAVLDIRN